MAEPSELEARVTALEVRVEEVAADAAAARHPAAARDRDIADLGVKVDANRSAINALGVQTAASFDRAEHEVGDLGSG
jgi:outer membrane murein-binding lipoprotein Lpp